MKDLCVWFYTVISTIFGILSFDSITLLQKQFMVSFVRIMTPYDLKFIKVTHHMKNI